MKFNKPFVLSLILFFSLISFYFFIFSINIIPSNINVKNLSNVPTNEDKRDVRYQIEYDSIRSVEKNRDNSKELEIIGWIPDWDIDDGLKTVENRPEVFTTISPVWFFINDSGELKYTPKTNGEKQIILFKNNKINLVPSLQEFDPLNFSKFIYNSEKVNNLIEKLALESIKNNYYGIDLDIEAIYLRDKEKFFEFLELIAKKFKEINKKLIFTALPKWSDYYPYTFLKETLEVQDYKRISEIVDQLRIMSYEYTNPKNNLAGPIQPLNWQERVIQYAIYKGVPRDKIVLGISTYSYDWPNRDLVDKIDFEFKEKMNIPILRNDKAVALVNRDVDRIKNNYQYIEKYNEVWGEMVLTYIFQGNEMTLIYPNDRSIQDRKELAIDYGIKGIAFWRLGDENNLKY